MRDLLPFCNKSTTSTTPGNATLSRTLIPIALSISSTCHASTLRQLSRCGPALGANSGSLGLPRGCNRGPAHHPDEDKEQYPASDANNDQERQVCEAQCTYYQVNQPREHDVAQRGRDKNQPCELH